MWSSFLMTKSKARKILLIFPALLILSRLSGQEFIWQAGYRGFFDNREYSNEYDQSQTMFGSGLYAYGGLKINESHSFCAGLDFLFEFGSTLKKDFVSPILFYQLQKENFEFRFGSFPRKSLTELPDMLQSDTINYYRPNLQGMFLNLEQSWGSQNLWLDWKTRQTGTDRETFQIGGTGKLKLKKIFYRHDFIMTHYANPGIRIPGIHIRDNGGLCTRIGIDLSGYVFDSLSLSTGYCFSYDRTRSEYDFRFRHGSLTELYCELYGLGLRTTLYFGDGQVQMGGDRLYAASSYQRFDLVWSVFRKDHIDGKLELSFHLVENTFDYSQAFVIHVDLVRRRIPAVRD
jgi:hypothetical protein